MFFVILLIGGGMLLFLLALLLTEDDGAVGRDETIRQRERPRPVYIRETRSLADITIEGEIVEP